MPKSWTNQTWWKRPTCDQHITADAGPSEVGLVGSTLDIQNLRDHRRRNHEFLATGDLLHHWDCKIGVKPTEPWTLEASASFCVVSRLQSDRDCNLIEGKIYTWYTSGTANWVIIWYLPLFTRTSTLLWESSCKFGTMNYKWDEAKYFGSP